MATRNIQVVACVLLTLLVVPSTAYEAVILVHGLAGWGNDEALGIGYWGFKGLLDPFGLNPRTDLANLVHLDTGMDVFVASVGPFSSNYDRAAELYAQIKGLRTDYGQSHSATHSHSRYPPVGSSTDYTPSFQNGIHHPSAAYTNGNRLTALANLANLGTDPSVKVHLIGHSMGCPTIRMFERLMRHGSPAEAGTPNMSPLYSVPSSSSAKATSIKSITCVAGVNSGSTLHAKLEQAGSPLSLVTAIKNLLLGVEQFNNFAGSPLDTVYDFDLNQFSQLQKVSGESFSQWTDRVFADPVWNSAYSDLAHWDLSPGFMINFNREAGKSLAYSGTKYFSAATFQTERCDLINALDPFVGSVWYDQCRDEDMELLLQPTANLMGNIDGVCDSIDSSLCFGNAHERNDALVSVDMQKRPLTSTATETRAENIPQQFVCDWYMFWWCGGGHYEDNWSAVPTASWTWREYEFDHLQVCGLRFSILEWDNPRDTVWKDIVAFLKSVKTGGTSASISSSASPATSLALGAITIAVVLSVGALAFVKRKQRRELQRRESELTLDTQERIIQEEQAAASAAANGGGGDAHLPEVTSIEMSPVPPAHSVTLPSLGAVPVEVVGAEHAEDLDLPTGWQRHYHGEFPYYHNENTGETVWERPQ